MHILSHRVVRAGCAILLCTALGISTAYASTANSIRGAYGLALSKDVAPIKEELLQVQRTIRDVQEIEVYNAIIASLSTDEIDVEIATKSAQADELRKQVVGGIDLPLEDILRYEAEYAVAVEKLDGLLGARDSYTAEPIPTPDEDLQTLLTSAAALQSSIKDAGYYEDIGSLAYYPVTGQRYHVNSAFGSRYDPVGVRGYSFHYGVDLKAPERTPIGAWFSGTIIGSSSSYGSGNYVWIDHGYGVKSYYCHLDSSTVTVGQHVAQGTRIALSGNTGYYTTGPHLHLGLYIDGVAVDPRVILQ